MEAEVETAVCRLILNRSGGHKQLRGLHSKTCLREAYLVKEAINPPKPDKWIKCVELAQFMCEHGNIPAELGWMIFILIPKGNTDT